jgi:outer membrane receptor protein involved in Fe transport
VELVKERADNTFVTDANFEGIPVNRLLAGFFVEGRYDASPRAGLTLGVRLERIERGALVPDAFGSRPQLDEDVVWSLNPKVSAVWFLRGNRASSATEGWTKIRGGAGTGIKPPTVFELGFTDNPSLKPERSRSFDAGIEHAPAGTPVVFEVTGFFNQYDDLIVSVGAGIADASDFRTDNVANARAGGLESAVRWISPAGLSIRGSYTYLRTRVLDVDDVTAGAPSPYVVGDWLIRRPRHTFSIDADYARGPFTAFLQINGRGRMLDVEPNLGAPTLFSDGYKTVALGGAYRIGRQLEFFARVTNVMDRDYEEALGYPSLGRSAMAGLRVAIGR